MTAPAVPVAHGRRVFRNTLFTGVVGVLSLFANFLSVPLILLMFGAEYAVRRRALPQVQTSSLIATLRMYFANPP